MDAPVGNSKNHPAVVSVSMEFEIGHLKRLPLLKMPIALLLMGWPALFLTLTFSHSASSLFN